MTFISEIRGTLQRNRRAVAVITCLVVLFWISYLYIDVRSWHKRNIEIIGERFDEIIYHIKSNAMELSGYRSLSTAIALNASLPAGHILNQWNAHNPFVSAVAVYDREKRMFASGGFHFMNNEFYDVNENDFKGDLVFNGNEQRNAKKEYILKQIYDRSYLLLQYPIIGKQNSMVDGRLIVAVDLSSIFAHLLSQQRLSGNMDVAVTSSTVDKICYIGSSHLANDYVCSDINAGFILSQIGNEVVLIVISIIGSVLIGTMILSFRSNKHKLSIISTISSHIAHDMRSPLSVLKTYAGLQTGADEDPDVEDLRKSAMRSVGKLEHMANDLVNYAKASKVEKSQHHLSGIIYEGAIAEAKRMAEEHGVKISCAMQGGILVNVDSYKLERVITNLINNAVQSIENGNGEVTISATTEHNGTLKITVRDNGKGIDAEALPHVFDSFFTKGKKGGTGLGLAYCKQVIEAHGGTIDVASEPDKGTTFTIKIPSCAVEHADAPVCHSRESGNPETSTPGSPIKALGDDILIDPSPVPLSTNTRPELSRSILIADDDPDIRRQWHKIIPEHGGTIVHTAKTVKEVEDAQLDYTKIDTAIVDYQFYGEDKTGIDLIKYLKAKGVKTVYLCTGFYDNEVIINQAQATGATRILPKPIDLSFLG